MTVDRTRYHDMLERAESLREELDRAVHAGPNVPDALTRLAERFRREADDPLWGGEPRYEILSCYSCVKMMRLLYRPMREGKEGAGMQFAIEAALCLERLRVAQRMWIAIHMPEILERPGGGSV